VSGLLHVEVSAVAAEHIREADAWWRTNRPKAPNAIREELERASALIAAQPDIGSRARNVIGWRSANPSGTNSISSLPPRVAEAPRQVEILGFWHASRGSEPPI